ncbi:DNA replication and repair protein RecF, partial [Stenotrophomonas maltophilia]
YSRALKQRNSLLKHSRQISLTELEPWNKLLAVYGEMLHNQRSLMIEQWQVFLQQDLQQLLPELRIELDYQAGFHQEHGLFNDLIQYHAKDV